MSKRNLNKFKIARKYNVLGINNLGKTELVQKKQALVHKQFYGQLLNEKQKLSLSYGLIVNKTLSRIKKTAASYRYDNLIRFVQDLECRLDNLVYRSCFGSTIFECRQLVNHGHILVNNKKVNIPSYKLKKSDTIQVKRTSVSLVKERISSQIETKIVLRENLIQAPSYLEVNYKLMKAVLVSYPLLNEIPYKINIIPKYVTEYYDTTA